MARASQTKDYVNFTGGLVTEATGLTYPENTCRDMNNVDLDKSGRVSRRLALSEELGGADITVPTGLSTTTTDDCVVTSHDWPSPGGVEGMHFVVIQLGHYLVVRNLASGEDVSGNIPTILGNPTASIPWTPGAWNGPDGDYGVTAADQAESGLKSTVGLGRIWFTGPNTVPFFLEYDPDTTTIWRIEVGGNRDDLSYNMKIRDFKLLDDGMRVSEQPPAEDPNYENFTEEQYRNHLYNLFNAGWPPDISAFQYISDRHYPPLTKYLSRRNRFPSNSQQWILGKNAEDNFDPALLAKQDFGESPAPRGKFLLDVLTGDRDEVAIVNIASLDDNEDFWTSAGTGNTAALTLNGEEDEPAVAGGSFKTVAFHAGRLWLSGDVNPKRPNGVYFSQVIQDVSDAGKFHQRNDPTSEHFFELYDDDGGVIYIPEANNITHIEPFLSGVVVFAENGVWFIRGGEAGFTAVEYSVDRISSVRCRSTHSVVETDSALLFWADSGVFAVGSQDGFSAQVQKLSDPIEGFFKGIDPVARRWAEGVYDQIGQKVIWFYNGEATTRKFFKNKALVFDTVLGAFYPLTTSLGAGENEGIVSAFFYDNIVYRQRQAPGEVSASTADPSTYNIKLVWHHQGTETANILEFSGESFYDWAGAGETPVSYSSYLETGHEAMQSISRRKQVTYLTSLFEATEKEYVTAGGTLLPYIPSACTVACKWDWHSSNNGNRWSRPQAAYRRRRPITDQGVDNGAGIVYTKLKVRGAGNALSIRYESEEGKDFRLIGFSAEFTA